MNRQGLILFVLFMLATTTAEAGRIYGSLQVNGKAVSQGTTVVVNCGNKSFATQVGKHGRYSVNVNQEGSCTLLIEGYTGASTNVVSYKEATRYNFALSSSDSGFVMKRN